MAKRRRKRRRTLGLSVLPVLAAASVGREDKDKYESCVMSVKGEDNTHEGLTKERIEEIIQEETVKAINRRQARIDE